MASNRMERLATAAQGCATHQSPCHNQGRPFGAYVRSKFYAGGFGFANLQDAAAYVNKQRGHAIRDGQLDDFSAAIVGADGQVYALYS